MVHIVLVFPNQKRLTNTVWNIQHFRKGEGEDTEFRIDLPKESKRLITRLATNIILTAFI